MATKCNTCNNDGMIRPPYWRNGNLGFMAYPWGSWQPVIPSLYWEAISPEQAVHDLYCYVENLLSYSNTQTGWIKDNHDLIEELQALFDKFKESGFDDYYRDQVIKWLDNHLEFIFTHTAKQVFFGLTSDGYFCAYIPESWSEIEFDTGMVYGQFDYGRLILRYNATGSGVIDNTGRYDDYYNDLERRVRHNENTLYSPMANGGEV